MTENVKENQGDIQFTTSIRKEQADYYEGKPQNQSSQFKPSQYLYSNHIGDPQPINTYENTNYIKSPQNPNFTSPTFNSKVNFVQGATIGSAANPVQTSNVNYVQRQTVGTYGNAPNAVQTSNVNYVQRQTVRAYENAANPVQVSNSNYVQGQTVGVYGNAVNPNINPTNSYFVQGPSEIKRASYNNIDNQANQVGGPYPGRNTQTAYISKQVEREVQRPSYRKSFSNAERLEESRKRKPNPGGNLGSDAKKDSVCCNPLLIALLGILGLAALVLAILLGTGVIGGASNPGETPAGSININGVEYPQYSVKVEKTIIDNDSPYIVEEKDGKRYIRTEDDKEYQVETIQGNDIIEIDGQPHLYQYGQVYKIEKENGDSYAMIDGDRYELPDSNELIDTDEDGNKFIRVDGNKYQLETVNGDDYATVGDQKYIIQDNQKYLVEDNTYMKNGVRYFIDDNGQKYSIYQVNGHQLVSIDDVEYMVENGEKYEVQTRDNGEQYAEIDGEEVQIGPRKNLRTVEIQEVQEIDQNEKTVQSQIETAVQEIQEAKKINAIQQAVNQAVSEVEEAEKVNEVEEAVNSAVSEVEEAEKVNEVENSIDQGVTQVEKAEEQ